MQVKYPPFSPSRLTFTTTKGAFVYFFFSVLLNFTKNLVRAFSSFRWECAQHFDFLVPKYLSLFKIFDLKHVLLKLHINVWSFDGFFYPFVGTLHPFMVEVFFFLLWSRSFYPFVVEVYLSFCGDGLFILLW